jgi:TonB family protein
MKKITLMLFLMVAKVALAQQDTTLVYASPMYEKDPIRSKWRPVVKKNAELWQVAFYDRKDLIQEVINFEDRNLEVRKGPYTFYDKGKVKEKGHYDKGHKDGEWLLYNDGNLAEKKIYAWGKLNGKTITYWNNQQIKEEGDYAHDKKIGKWKMYYDDGKMAGDELYDEYGKKQHEEYFDRSGKVVKYEDLFQAPNYKGGFKEFYKFLAKEIKYPENAARNRIQGTVKLSFVVKKDGNIEDIMVLESPSNDLTGEAVRVLRRSTDWLPGKQFGESVNVRFTVPIKFNIN